MPIPWPYHFRSPLARRAFVPPRRLFLAAVVAVLVIPSSAHAVAYPGGPGISNYGDAASSNPSWVETQSVTEGTRMFGTLVVTHAENTAIESVRVQGVGYPWVEVVGVNRSILNEVPMAPHPGVNGTTTVARFSVRPFGPFDVSGNRVLSCTQYPFNFGSVGTRRADTRMQVQVSDGRHALSGTGTRQTLHWVAADDCRGVEDYPAFSGSIDGGYDNTKTTPGTDVTFNFQCGDPDNLYDGENYYGEADSNCDVARWRWRRLNDGATSAFTEVDADDGTPRTITTSFPTRGVYVVEAYGVGENGGVDSDSGSSPGALWRLGTVMVNDETAPTLNVSLTGPNVFTAAHGEVSVNAGAQVTAVSGLSGKPAQRLEWDTNDDPLRESVETALPMTSGGQLVYPTPLTPTLRFFAPPAGHRTLSVKAYDRGAIDVGDDMRRSRTDNLFYTVNAIPTVPSSRSVTTTDEDTPVEITLTGTDTDNGPGRLTYEVVSQPDHGSVSITGNKATFTPAADFAGATSFTYRVHDRGDTTDRAWSNSNTGTVPVNVTAQNDAPHITTSPAALAYTEGDGDVVADPALALTDVDSATLSGATAAISSGYVEGQDALSFADTGGITGSFDSSTGVLTLSGDAPIADYQGALSAVRYRNGSDDPSGSRTISFRARDSQGAESDAATRGVDLTATQPAPAGGQQQPSGPGEQPVQPTVDRTAPSLTWAPGKVKLATLLKSGLPMTFRCSEACAVDSALELDARTAKKLKLTTGEKAVQIGASHGSLGAAGNGSLAIKLTAKAKKALKKVRSLKVAVVCFATDRSGNATAPARKAVTLKR